MSSTVQAVGVIVLVLALWPVLRRLTAKHPFHNVRGPPPKSWLKGNILDLLNKQAWEYHHELVKEYGNAFKFKGFLGEQCLHVLDPKALHYILIKDADSYDELQAFYTTTKLVFGNGLLSSGGDHHRRQRKMLNPVFSIAHMRRMVPTFYEVVDKLRDTLEAKAKQGPVEVDLLTWMSRTALELIGQSGLGYSFDPLTETGEQHPYSVSVKGLVSSLEKLSFTRFVIMPVVHNLGTARFRRSVVDFLSLFWGNVRRARDIVDTMDETSHAIYEAKKKALAEGGDALQHHAGKGNDLISILMKANMQASEADRLPEDEVMGQITTFTFAAMDTTSSALARIFHVLSQNQEFQERLRREIHAAKAQKGGQLEYDDLMALPLLDATCRETLRVYAPVAMVMRESRKDVVLPLSKPVIGVDGKQINEILVPKGTKIILGNYSANRNPELWGPDAHEWKPERWLSPLPDELVKAKIPGVYSHLMTFIGGGRSCIGFKFSELEMKVVLAEVLDTLRLTPVDKKIMWNMTGVAHPVVTDGSGTEKPQLPIRVELLG